ncbi:hypothetical protein HBH70_046130 [Parastagonospora nodorum]|nr:hypothetical protein HBH70_046130 [Parastagonospora nodorum]KAH5523768.1 hypothetical protein HBI29_035260 [Parastagonospora nodorum]
MVAALQATRVTSSHGRKQAQCGGCASFAQSLAGSNQSMIVTVRIRSAETRRSTRVGHKALERTSRIFQGHENVLAVLTRALEQKRLENFVPGEDFAIALSFASLGLDFAGSRISEIILTQVIRFFQLRRLHIQRSSLHAVLRHAGDAVRESNCSG